MVVVLHTPLSLKTTRMVVQVAFIVAQLLLSNLVTAINFVSQTVTKHELLLLEHLPFLELA